MNITYLQTLYGGGIKTFPLAGLKLKQTGNQRFVFKLVDRYI